MGDLHQSLILRPAVVVEDGEVVDGGLDESAHYVRRVELVSGNILYFLKQLFQFSSSVVF